jgi:hypothetical protein
MTWEYKTVWLPKGEPSESWEDQAQRWSKQLTELGAEGWEIPLPTTLGSTAT